jgi:hypothetical protein
MEIPNKPNTIKSTDSIKFSDEEMLELSSIRTSYEKITLGLGQCQIQKREIESNESKILSQLKKTEEQEDEFLKQILAKYGEGTVNQDTGVFTPKSA